mmetsp:Transcript_34566/g.78990  ORF Transcript_34566/g.78990 Transcript_34566/m.78990 type:complete len:920 (+) Transcript_34566:30-2789(+)
MPPKKPGTADGSSKSPVRRHGTGAAHAKRPTTSPRDTSGARKRVPERRISHPQVKIEHDAECVALQKELFDLADKDKGGTIQYFEFEQLHKRLMCLAAEQVTSLAPVSTETMEQQFRSHDTDHNFSLDYDEWVAYTNSILSLLGPKAFKVVCGSMLEEEKRKKEEEKERYDAMLSARLLDKVKGASHLKGECQARLEADALLAKQADPNYQDSEGSHTLIHAAGKSDAEFIKKLLDGNANPSLFNKELDCAAFIAAHHRNLEVLRLLLIPSAPRPSEEERLSDEASAELVRAMSKLLVNEARDLLQKKADVNYKDPNGWSPLTSAVFWGRKDTVEMILRWPQLNPGVRLRINIQNSRGRSALHVAARKGRAELVPLLIGGRADVDLQDVDGWTPLHHAAFNGMDEVVQELISGSASVTIQGKAGFTPWMVSTLPTHAGTLKESTLKLIMPSDHVLFAKKVAPVLNDTSKTAYTKLDDLLTLPGVNRVPLNLRMHEQFFSTKTGPNKVRLQSMFKALAAEMIRRLRTGECESDPGGNHLADDENRSLREERHRRERDQKQFIRAWFQESAGPPISADWNFDSREAYREELNQLIREEKAFYKEEMAALFKRVSNEASGTALLAMDECEVLQPTLATQLDAHPILTWLDAMDVADTFEALRQVCAAGMGRDDDEALQSFMDLICQNPDFDTGLMFWTNVYKLWLSHYAQAAQLDFQQRLRHILNDYKATHGEGGLASVEPLRIVQPKTYERMMYKEDVGAIKSGVTNIKERSAACAAMDLLRGSIVVKNPSAAVTLVDDYFRPLTIRDNKMELVSIKSSFNSKADPPTGYREIVLNVIWDGGLRSAPCGRPNVNLQFTLCGEVKIILEDFLVYKKKMHLINKFLAGEFDHKDVEESTRLGKGKTHGTISEGGGDEPGPEGQ